MKRLVLIALAGLAALLLGGCATTIRSEVTSFQQWPATLDNKAYVFEAPPPQEDTLEWRSYQNLVRAELNRLGLHDVGAAGTPALSVSMRFMTTDIPMRVIQVSYPSGFYPSFGFYGRHRHAFWGGWYDPFWYGPEYRESIEHTYRRELQVAIKSVPDNRRLYDVTVRNLSRTMSTPQIMPALVRSAFEGFPGPNGGARIVELRLDK